MRWCWMIGFVLLFGLTVPPLSADEMSAAICDSDVDRVKQLIDSGQFGVNERTIQDGEEVDYPLELACYCNGGRPEVANALLDRDADPNLFYWTHPLMGAFRKLNTDPVQEYEDPLRGVIVRLIQGGADVDHIDVHGRTPLMGAAYAGDRELVRMLMRKGATNEPRTIDDYCVEDNYDLNCTAADHARMGGHVALALEIEGKDPSPYYRTLNHAIMQGDERAVASLIDGGVDLNAKEQLSQWTAIQYAVFYNRAGILRTLLQNGADPNVQDYAGASPLREAIVYDRVEVAKILIDHGASVNNEQTQGCGNGMTELAWAIDYAHFDVVRHMIEKGAVDPQNPGMAFQMLYGVSEEHVGLTRLLLDKGARPTATDIETLKTLRAEMEWLNEAGYVSRIIDMLETALNEAEDPNMPAIVVRPTIDISELHLRRRGSQRGNLQRRSLQSAPPEVQRFDMQYRGSNGRLDPRPMR